MHESRHHPVENLGNPRSPRRVSRALLTLGLLPLLVMLVAPLVARPLVAPGLAVARAMDSTPSPPRESALGPVVHGQWSAPATATGFVWLVQNHTTSGQASTAAPRRLGFVVPRSGSLAVFDRSGATLVTLQPGEASFLPEGAERAFGSGDGNPVSYFQISQVPADAVPDPLPLGTSASKPLTILAGDVALDLAAGTLDTGAVIDFPAGSYPALFLVTEGIVTLRDANGTHVVGSGESTLVIGAAQTRNPSDRSSRFVLVQLSPATARTAEQHPGQEEQPTQSGRRDGALDVIWERNGCPLNPANPPCLVIAQAAACAVDPTATRCAADSDGDGCLDIGEVGVGLDAFDSTDCLPDASGHPAVNCLFPIANRPCGQARRS